MIFPSKEHVFSTPSFSNHAAIQLWITKVHFLVKFHTSINLQRGWLFQKILQKTPIVSSIKRTSRQYSVYSISLIECRHFVRLFDQRHVDDTFTQWTRSTVPQPRHNAIPVKHVRTAQLKCCVSREIFETNNTHTVRVYSSQWRDITHDYNVIFVGIQSDDWTAVQIDHMSSTDEVGSGIVHPNVAHTASTKTSVVQSYHRIHD